MPWGHAKIGAAENTKKIKCCLNSPEAGMTRACRLCGSLSVHEEDGSEDEDVDMDDSDESGSEADSDDQGDISDDEESSELEGPLDTGSTWTDTDDTGSHIL